MTITPIDPATDIAVNQAVDALRDELVTLVARAVATPSVTGDELAVARLLERWLADNGFETRLEPVPADLVERHPQMTGEHDLERRPNLLGLWRGDGSSELRVVLNGHIDTVNVERPAEWEQDPYGGAVVDGRLWGRGAADMKGGLIAGMFALRALRDAGVTLPYDVQVQGVVGEESSGIGTIGALETERRPDAAIVLEPSDGVVCPACGGSLQFEVSVEGVAAHAATPWMGISALEKGLLVEGAIRRLAARRNGTLEHPLFAQLPEPAPYAIGVFAAGVWRASVPGTASFGGRIGVMPSETIAEVRAAVREAIDEVAQADEWLREHPPALTWVNDGYPSWETPPEHPLTRSLTAASVAVHGKERVGAVTYGSDAGHFAAAGVPVAIYGPGRITDAHTDNEYVEVRQLVDAVRVLALALTRLRPEAAR